MTEELYKRIRPKSLDEVIGQTSAVTVLKKMVAKEEIPHALLLSGPSGTGKTTITRILRKPLKCHPKEYHEMDSATVGGIEEVRDIRKAMWLRPLNGGAKMWVFDEAHKLTGPAQDGLLKILEDGAPPHVWFILATTNPRKLLDTIRTRCTEIVFKSIRETDLQEIIKSAYETEKEEGRTEAKSLPDSVVTKIIQDSVGSARLALVLLEKALLFDDEDGMLEAIEKGSQEVQAINLCRKLLNRPRWPDVAQLLKELEGEEPEGLRRMVLGYMRSVVLGGSGIANNAYRIQCCFERNFFDTGNAGLEMACWEAVNGGK